MEHIFGFLPVLVVATAMIALRLTPMAVYRFVKGV